MASAIIAETDDDRLVWRCLADGTRRAILDLLRTSPATTGTIAAAFPISRIAVMKHLALLTDAGLVTSRKRGRERWYYVNLAPVLELHTRWSTPLGAGLAAGMNEVKRRVEARASGEDNVSAEVNVIDVAVDVDIAGSPAAVFAALTNEPGAWWGLPYLRPDATAVELDASLGGHVIERWEGGALMMAAVTGVAADRWLQLTGPFHLGVATVATEFDLTPTETGCHLALTCRGSGLIDPAMIEGFTGGWQELVGTRLKAFVEDGTRLGIDAG